MNLRFKSTIPSFRALMPKAYFLNRNDMEQKTIIVPYKGRDYEVHVEIRYSGINSMITAEVGNSHLAFNFTTYGGLKVEVTGEQVNKGLLLEIEWAVMKSLE